MNAATQKIRDGYYSATVTLRTGVVVTAYGTTEAEAVAAVELLVKRMEGDNEQA